MRGGYHSKDIREYEITSEGVVIGKHLHEFRGLVTGVPERSGSDIGRRRAEQGK
jgi:circadian clock protein KaiC